MTELNEQKNPSETNITNNQASYFQELLLNPFATNEEIKQTPAEIEAETKLSIYERLDEKEKQQAEAIAKLLVTDKLNSIADYGTKAQGHLNRFSHQMLSQIQSKDTGEIGENLRELMRKLDSSEIRELNRQERNPLKRLFKRAEISLYEVNAKYQQVAVQVDRIAKKLDSEQQMLTKDNRDLEQLYQENLQYFKVLNVYIAGAEIRLKELNEVIIPKKTQALKDNFSQIASQELSDLKAFANRLEKRIYDLKITRQVTIQQAPQIRLIQNTNQALAEKVQSSIHTAIPLWKNQMAIQLSLNRQMEALEAQKAVSETTNQLMRQNAELLHSQATDIAQENERGIVDLETLAMVQENLMQTIQETFEIQQAGHQKRMQAEQRLQSMEGELKQFLLDNIEEKKQLEEAKYQDFDPFN